MDVTDFKPFSLIKDLARTREILQVLAEYGFADLLKSLQIPTPWVDKLLNQIEPQKKELNVWQRIRLACEDLGPTFVKIGQILSTRPDLLNQELVEELKKLRDQVEPESHEKILKQLDAVLNDSWGNHFSSINQEPLGSASLAQVHKAILRKNRKTVALKIQRPDIEGRFESDLEIIGWLLGQLHERVDELKPYDLPEVLDTLKHALLQELDFRNEAKNLEVFNTINPNPDQVFAPGVWPEFTRKKLVVLDYVEGVSPAKFEAEAKEKKRIAKFGGKNLFHQILVTGFYHADPHPGNVLVTSDHRLCLIDWGAVGQLTRSNRAMLADLLDGVVDQDYMKILRLSKKLHQGTGGIDEEQLEMDISLMLNSHSHELNVGKAGEIMLEIARIFGRNGVKLSRDYTLLTKAILSVDETGRCLDPDFNIPAVAKPYLRQLKFERYRPDRVIENAWLTGEETFKQLIRLPGAVHRVVQRLENEDLNVNLKLNRLEHLANPLNQALNRVVLGLILGSLIIGSSMIMTTGVGPKLWGYPQLGLFGYSLSAVLGLWIVFDILRQGTHRSGKK